MDVKGGVVNKIVLSKIDRLDPVTVFTEDFTRGQGQITITCYGKAWTAFWGAIGDQTIAEFFCDCDIDYIAEKLSNIDSTVYDIDAIRKDADKKGIDIYRDDPWNDYDFLSLVYGNDPVDWTEGLPKTVNPEYEYLCRIIKAVQLGLNY